MVIDSRQMSFTIVGSALSPEYVYVPGPASMMPDDAHRGVFWAPRFVVEKATGLGGAFSAVALSLAAGASEPAVVAAVDRALAPYGGTPTVGRADQTSHKFQQERIDRLNIIAWVIPPVFLLVAAGLVQMVLSRLVETEREHVGLLKAFGYGDFEASSIYLKMSLLIGLIGAAAGGGVGAWMGGVVTRELTQYMRFPHLDVQFSWTAFLIAAAISVGAAAAGSLAAVRRATRLSPAVAMRPLTPTIYRRGALERLPGWHRLDQPTRLILRNLQRFAGRAALTLTGLAVSLSLLVGSQEPRRDPRSGLFPIPPLDRPRRIRREPRHPRHGRGRAPAGRVDGGADPLRAGSRARARARAEGVHHRHRSRCPPVPRPQP
jgi:putative ABC transport system permease protein